MRDMAKIARETFPRAAGHRPALRSRRSVPIRDARLDAGETQPLRVLLVDDHPLVRTGIRAFGIITDRPGEFLVRFGMQQGSHSPAILRARVSEFSSDTP